MSVFFLTMSLYPEVQRKAQEELDRVIGHERLPSYEEYVLCPTYDLESNHWTSFTAAARTIYHISSV